MRQFVRADPEAFVFHGDPHFLSAAGRFGGLGAHADPTARATVLDGVSDEVLERLRKCRGICFD